MKRFLAAAIILLTLFIGQSCKKSLVQSSTNNNNTNYTYNNNYTNDTTSLITPIGSPVGNPVSKTIDASGGSIGSPDGVLQLIIPAGALSAATNISIQPVTSEVPEGLYYGYSLTPNGQQFQKPVTLEFHYNDQDLDTTDPAGLTVAYQTADQAWDEFTDVAVDTINKTVSVQSTHFTVFDLLPEIRISPEEAIIGLGKSLHIEQQTHWDADPYSSFPAFVRYTSSWDNIKDGPADNTTVWAVNNIKGGNKTIGTITTSANSSAIYTAPDKVPSPSTVWVTVTKQFWKSKIILRSKIRIVDGNAWHVYLQFFAPKINESGSYFNWSDAGSFDVTVSKGIGSVINITNRNATVTLDHNESTCTTTLIEPPVGPINIVYEAGGHVSFYYNTVSILFMDAIDKNYYIRDAVWKTECPGGQPTQSGGGLGPPYPANLQFPALDGTQTIVSGQYTMTVTRIQ